MNDEERGLLSVQMRILRGITVEHSRALWQLRRAYMGRHKFKLINPKWITNYFRKLHIDPQGLLKQLNLMSVAPSATADALFQDDYYLNLEGNSHNWEKHLQNGEKTIGFSDDREHFFLYIWSWKVLKIRKRNTNLSLTAGWEGRAPRTKVTFPTDILSIYHYTLVVLIIFGLNLLASF